MDGSSSSTSHMPRPDGTANGFNIGNTFLGGIETFADAADVASGNDDLASFIHPDLFEHADSTSNAQQQAQPNYQSAFNQHASRQSQSPALPQYNPQQSYTHSQFSQPQFERSMYQSQSYDPRMLQQQRSTHSPAPLEHFQYQNPSYNQNYLQQQQQRQQSSTPSQQYPPSRQQTYSPFGGWDSRTGPNFGSYQAFQEQNQQSSHGFVNPSYLSGNQLQNANGSYRPIAPQSQPQYQPSPYFSKAGSGVTIDPRSLQGQQFQQHQQSLYNQTQQQQQRPQQQALASIAQTGILNSAQANNILKAKAPKDPHAPKRPRGRPRKDGLPPKQAGEVETDSDSDLSVENEPELRPAFLTISMPPDFRGQSLYKATDAVWCDRNNPAPVEKVQTGIADFGNTVKAFRDSWKTKNENLKKAENENSTSAQIPLLKKDVGDDRAFMDTIMVYALRFGHPAILKSLGENSWVMSALYSFMLDRVTAGDLDSVLITSILKLAVNFNTLDEAKLEALKWSKLLQRLMKKATNESKGLAQKILSSASALTAKKKTDGDGSSPKPNGEVAGVKRAHDGSTVQPVVRKTVVKPSSKPLALQNAERRRAQEKEEAARKAKEAKEAPGSANGLSTKPKVVVPQKTNYSALMSASKRPGTTNAERAAAAKDKPTLAQPIKKEQGKRESPPRGIAAARPQTSFLGGLLGEFEKKKEVKPEKEDAAPDENPEQNAKRIRKESRRKMRVSWKADSELVQTRLFTHDPDEELGHDDSMMKDAGDTMKEGEMLKRKMGMSDLDDEDEEDESEDTYSPPSEVDFSGLPSDAQDSNGIKFGGKVKPESPSSRLQDAFEANTIMVVFDSKSERPITPKEAQDEGDDVDFQPCLDFGEPEDKVRAKERALQPQQSAGGFNLGALAQQLGQGQAAPQQPPDLSSILSNLSRQQAAPQPAAPAPAMDFSQLVANIHNMQSRPQQYAPAAPPASGQLDLSALLANYQQSNNTTLGKHSLDDAGESDKKKNKGLPANYKTQVCTFWKEGRCTKGDDCTYKHSE